MDIKVEFVVYDRKGGPSCQSLIKEHMSPEEHMEFDYYTWILNSIPKPGSKVFGRKMEILGYSDKYLNRWDTRKKYYPRVTSYTVRFNVYSEEAFDKYDDKAPIVDRGVRTLFMGEEEFSEYLHVTDGGLTDDISKDLQPGQVFLLDTITDSNGVVDHYLD